MSKIDPCCMCRKRVMDILILCMNYRKQNHRRCTKIKKVMPGLANKVVCACCGKVVERAAEPVASYAMRQKQ